MENALLWTQAATAIFIGIALCVSIGQLRTMQDQLKNAREEKKGRTLMDLILYLQNQDIREARDFVVTNLLDQGDHSVFVQPYDTWKDSPDIRKKASTVCQSYDVAGILIKNGLLDGKPIIDNWGQSVVLCHNALDGLIKDMRRYDRAGEEYWDEFTWLYDLSLIRHKGTFDIRKTGNGKIVLVRPLVAAAGTEATGPTVQIEGKKEDGEGIQT